MSTTGTGDRWFKEAAQQAKVVETIRAIKAGTRAQGTPLGETGRFTHGVSHPVPWTVEPPALWRFRPMSGCGAAARLMRLS